MKIETEEIALKDVVDEMCPDVGYDAKPTAEVVKSHYPDILKIATNI